MSARRAAMLAWLLWLVLALPTLVLLALGASSSTPGDEFGLGGLGGLSFVLASAAFGTVGALVAARVPGNRIGWIFLITALAVIAGDLAYQYADQVLYASSGALPGATAAAWSQNLTIPPAFGLLGMALLLFPDGRLPSARWRPALGLSVIGMALIVLGYALRPGPLDEPFTSVVNPLGVGGTLELLDALAGLGWLLMAASVALAAAAMASRLRNARGAERQQLKWIALAAAVTGVAIVTDVVTFFVSAEGINQLRIVLLGLGFAALPLAAGAAILRYRLYDIDVVINRALVYGALTVALGAAYLATVLLLQLALQPLTTDSQLAVAGSTLAVAALFRPARRRIQGTVDRRFYRNRFDAQRTLEAFSSTLRDQVELDSLSDQLRQVVRNTMQPAHVSLWLRQPRSRS
jgi:hypothetical protein